MKKVIAAGILGLLAIGMVVSLPVYLKIKTEFARLESDDPLVWESVIRKFEEEDLHNPPPRNATLFVGSSSIRFWNGLEKDFHPIPVIKRGFGGAKLGDILYYADRIIIKYRPKVIVLFAGTNDICGNENDKSPEQVLNDLKDLVTVISGKLPETQLIYLPITPTISRWHIWPEAQRANEFIANYLYSQDNAIFLDTEEIFLDQQGLSRKELLWWDGVHLNGKGYVEWVKPIKPVLEEEYF